MDKITKHQESFLSTLICERLNRNSNNIRDVEYFWNSKNERLVDTLQNEAFEEDNKNTKAYYLVKDKIEGRILFFFSLQCGNLYDKFIESERYLSIKNAISYLNYKLRHESLTESKEKEIKYLIRTLGEKKGIKKNQLFNMLNKEPKNRIEDIISSDLYNVLKTHPGIELVHFCANEEYRNWWKMYLENQKLGAVVFWLFIEPIISKVMELVGCEYIYLFAADKTIDEHLINYYRYYLKFRDLSEISTIIPIYDFFL